jgi:NitT/TauT family transport system permease protein
MTVAATLWRNTPLLLLALGWETASRTEIVSNALLPALSQVIAAWFELAASGDLLNHGAVSLYRSLTGLMLAVGVGIALGACMAWWKPLRLLLSGLVEIFYPLPKSALIPVTALWLGFGDASKILLIFLGCLLPVMVGAFNGVRASEETLIWSARNMGATRLRTLWDVGLPSALPEVLNGCRTALALSFILLVSSELISSQAGFGYLIGALGSAGNYASMFAVVLTAAFLGFIADSLYEVATRKWQV